jgi:hypothetical protein
MTMKHFLSGVCAVLFLVSLYPGQVFANFEITVTPSLETGHVERTNETVTESGGWFKPDVKTPVLDKHITADMLHLQQKKIEINEQCGFDYVSTAVPGVSTKLHFFLPFTLNTLLPISVKVNAKCSALVDNGGITHDGETFNREKGSGLIHGGVIHITADGKELPQCAIQNEKKGVSRVFKKNDAVPSVYIKPTVTLFKCPHQNSSPQISPSNRCTQDALSGIEVTDELKKYCADEHFKLSKDANGKSKKDTDIVLVCNVTDDALCHDVKAKKDIDDKCGPKTSEQFCKSVFSKKSSTTPVRRPVSCGEEGGVWSGEDLKSTCRCPDQKNDVYIKNKGCFGKDSKEVKEERNGCETPRIKNFSTGECSVIAPTQTGSSVVPGVTQQTAAEKINAQRRRIKRLRILRRSHIRIGLLKSVRRTRGRRCVCGRMMRRLRLRKRRVRLGRVGVGST